ncbi:hypothetical protein FS837_002856 [Tulasnella sp. UAMH 9824]|nr:hypothetical protein FS837_002856 [Tulasnella sp. UAMH 9824]
MYETDTEYCAADNPSADMVALVLPSSQVTLSNNAIEKREEGIKAIRSSHLYKGTSAPIDHLPHELLLEVFKLHVDLDTPVRSLVTLILVCKLWRNIVEGTPSLWCHISGREGLSSIQKALTMVKGAPLEVTYCESEAKVISAAFFAQIGDRIAQTKSLTVNVGRLSPFPAILETTSITILETLDLLVLWAPGGQRDAVTLFGGRPASPALKNFRVNHLPIALAPLRLSRLRSLGLSNIIIASAEEVLTILMESPTLEDCSLDQLDFSTEFTPSEHLQRLLRGESRIAGATLLLTLLSFHVQGKLNDSPASELLTADISHLAPPLKGSTSTTEKIDITLWEDRSWTLRVGLLTIEFEGVRLEPRHIEETIDWVYAHLGEHLKAFPTSLVIFEPDVSPELLLWVGMSLRVTNLELWVGERSPELRQIVSLLSRPVASLSNEWALPNLESFEANVLDKAEKWGIFEMVKARHSFIQAQEDQGRGDVALKPFKEIKLYAGGNLSKKQASHAEFLTAIENVGRGADIWWEEVKWVGNRA